MIDEATLLRAESIVAKYTLAAAATGAIPVPAASAAVVVETAMMFGHLSSVLGAEITWASIVESLGDATTLNAVGRIGKNDGRAITASAAKILIDKGKASSRIR